MVKPVGLHNYVPNKLTTHRPPMLDNAEAPEVPKSPGQTAKTEIGGSAQSDLPANIQGKTASAIARNLDLPSVLALQSPPTPQEPVEENPEQPESISVENAANDVDTATPENDPALTDEKLVEED